MGAFEGLADFVSDFKALKQKVADLVVQVSGIGGRFGSGTDIATWAGSRSSNERTVTHNLGWTPSRVWVTGNADQGTHVIAFQAYSFTSTTFKVRGDFTDGTAPAGPSPFAWLAER